MSYTKEEFESAVEELGEVFFVLESDREYIVHGKDGYTIDSGGVVTVEGMKDGELVMAAFPLDSIEHHYTHREL
jgi:hypothetical protein